MLNLSSSLAFPLVQSSDAALLMAKARQSAIFKSAHIASIAFNAQGEIQEFNLGAQRLLGYHVGNLTPQLNLADICEPFDLVTRAMAQSTDYGGTKTPSIEGVFELSCLSQDGHILPVLATVDALDLDGGVRASGYLLVLTPNTVYKPVQLFQNDLTSSLLKIASRLPGMVYQYRLHLDGSSCFPYVSDAIRDVYRVVPEDVREDASIIFSILHPEDQDGVIASIQKSAKELTPWQYEYRVRFSDGDVRWLFGNALPEREVDGATLWHGFITDVTERKTTEKALRLGERRIRATLAAIPDLMFEVDLAGCYHDFHSPRIEMLAAPVQDLIGHLVSEVLPVDAAHVVMAALQEANDRGYSSGKKFALTLAQGELWFELSISRKATEPGELPRFIVLSRDITERHQAKEQLRISDHALKAISQGVLIAGPDGRILSANAAFSSITGYSEAEILGRTCQFIQGVQTDAGVIATMRQAQLLATEFNGDILNYRKDGSTFWNELSITPMFDANGQVTHFIGITRDITARKLAQNALAQQHSTLEQLVTTRTAELSTALAVSQRVHEDLLRSQLMLEQSHQKLVSLLDSMAVGAYGVDTNGDCTFVNSAFLRLLGYSSSSELLGKHIHELIHHSHPDGSHYPDAQCRMHAAYQNHQSIHCSDEVFWCKDGISIAVEYWRRPIYTDGKLTGAIATFVDIIERKRLEVEVQEAKEYAENIVESVREPLIVLNAELKILTANHSFYETFKVTPADTIGHFIYDLGNRQWDIPKLRVLFEKILPNSSFFNGYEVEHDFLGIGHKTIVLNAREIYRKNVGSHIILLAMDDITERKLLEEQVRQLAFYDPLTKLPNRRLLNDRLCQLMMASKRNACHCAVMVLDLDNFKSLNDTHGHLLGDLLLIEAAQRLSSCVREVDTVARFGGDEFVVLLGELDVSHRVSTEQALGVAEKIRASLEAPYVLAVEKSHERPLGTVVHHCSASIGVVVFVDNEATQDDILKWADAAMYQAKGSGQKKVSGFKFRMWAAVVL